MQEIHFCSYLFLRLQLNDVVGVSYLTVRSDPKRKRIGSTQKIRTTQKSVQVFSNQSKFTLPRFAHCLLVFLKILTGVHSYSAWQICWKLLFLDNVKILEQTLSNRLTEVEGIVLRSSNIVLMIWVSRSRLNSRSKPCYCCVTKAWIVTDLYIAMQTILLLTL